MLKITTTANKAELFFDKVAKNLKDMRPVWIDFQTYMIGRVTGMFFRIRQGGTDRGVTWKWFSKNYKKRPSGALVDNSSSLMQDSGRMITALLSRQSLGGTRFIMDTPIRYAPWQHKLRPFQFFETPLDTNYLAQRVSKYLVGK